MSEFISSALVVSLCFYFQDMYNVYDSFSQVIEILCLCIYETVPCFATWIVSFELLNILQPDLVCVWTVLAFQTPCQTQEFGLLLPRSRLQQSSLSAWGMYSLKIVVLLSVVLELNLLHCECHHVRTASCNRTVSVGLVGGIFWTLTKSGMFVEDAEQERWIKIRGSEMLWLLVASVFLNYWPKYRFCN